MGDGTEVQKGKGYMYMYMIHVEVLQKTTKFCKAIILQLKMKNSTFKKTKIMASSIITFWQIDGETMETVTDIIFLSSKITADGDCSHEIKRYLLLGRKAITNVGSILKSRDIICRQRSV